jgi:hypothetical protein
VLCKSLTTACKTVAVDTKDLVQLLKSCKQPIDAKGVKLELESRLSTPFFKYDGPSDKSVETVVRRCWFEVNQAEEVTHGPNPKQYLVLLLGIAQKWGKDADSVIYGPAERALFRYNEALVNSVVLAAIREGP